MKIITYGEAVKTIGKDGKERVKKEIRELIEELHSNKEFRRDWEVEDTEIGIRYGKSNIDYGFASFLEQVKDILYVVKGMDNLKGKTLLDLGCGTVHNNYGIESPLDTDYPMYSFEPWICRLLPYLGVKTIGIDIENMDDEKFEHYSINLLEPNSLSFLPDNSVDVANSRWFFESPTLLKLIYGEEVNDKSPERYQIAKSEIKDILIPQLERIVKPEGIFSYWDY